jgi:hypothetical protein
MLTRSYKSQKKISNHNSRSAPKIKKNQSKACLKKGQKFDLTSTR